MIPLLDDLRFAVRLHRRSMATSGAALLLLSLGMGASLSIFQVASAVLVRALPGVRGAENIVMVGKAGNGGGFSSVSFPEYRDVKERAGVFAAVAAQDQTALSLSMDGYTERITGELVTASYFNVLGVRLALGRHFSREEDEVPGKGTVALISHQLWKDRFGGSRDILGRRLMLNGTPFEVIGVLEPGFRNAFLPTGADVWTPMAMQKQLQPGWDLLERRESSWMHILARLKTGKTLADAQGNMASLSNHLRQAFPAYYEKRSLVAVRYHAAGNDAGDLATYFGILLGVTLLVLLVIAANVANLLLARTIVRGRELAIRRAVGASGGRIARQLLMEGMVLGGLGAGCGVLVSLWGADALFRAIPGDEGLPVALRLEADWRVMSFGVILAIVSAVSFTLPALWRASQPDLQPVLRGGELAASPRRSFTRIGLSVVQVALCVVLLAGTSLLSQTVHRLREAGRAAAPAKVALFDLDPELNGYSRVAGLSFYGRLLEEVRAMPGVESATLSRIVPGTGGVFGISAVYGGVLGKEAAIEPGTNIVAENYFATYRVGLVEGRAFTAGDSFEAPPVAVVSTTLARRLFGGQNAIGQQVYFRAMTLGAQKAESATVIGVTADVPFTGPEQPVRDMIYFSFRQFADRNLRQTLAVRLDGEATPIYPAVKQAAQRLDANLPLFHIRSLEDAYEENFFSRSLIYRLTAGAGLASILIAAIGLYGMLSFHVAQRTREIAIRCVLGAERGAILRGVLREGLAIAVAGVVLGVLLARGAAIAIQSMLYGVAAGDAKGYAAAAAILLVTASVACLQPALRAMRTEPVAALRYE